MALRYDWRDQSPSHADHRPQAHRLADSGLGIGAAAEKVSFLTADFGGFEFVIIDRKVKKHAQHQFASGHHPEGSAEPRLS